MNSDEMSIIIPCPKPKIDPKVQLEIERLQKYSFVELEAVQQFHAWLDDKRSCRQACRVIGDSRTGKTLASDTYRLKNAPKQQSGDAPLTPVIYWYATTETGQRELFEQLLECLKYRITRGTLSELRQRVYRLLKACQVEMIIRRCCTSAAPQNLIGSARHLRFVRDCCSASRDRFPYGDATRTARCSGASRRAGA